VLGPDRTIYIGTANGWLVALYPDYQPAGQIKWAVQVPGQGFTSQFYAVQTPAVADDGTIYCICTPEAVVRDHRGTPARAQPSYLVSLSPNGTRRWVTTPDVQRDLLGDAQGTLNGAPRLLSLPQSAGGSGVGRGGGRAEARTIGSGPLVNGNPVNQQTRIVAIARYSLIQPDPTLGPDSRNRNNVSQLMIVNDIMFGEKRPEPQARVDQVDFEEKFDFVDAQGSGGVGGDDGATLTETGPSDLPADAFPCADTPVILGSLPATGPWSIIATGIQGLYAVGWDSTLFQGTPGQLTKGPTLLPLQTLQPPLTAAFANGLVAGFFPGEAALVDPDAFTTLAEASLVPSQGIPFFGQETVAGGGRQMYFINRFGHLFAVDFNGTIWRERGLNHGCVACPALSGNHLHVATTAGLHTLTLDLQDVAFFPLDGAGFSSPAIGPDGAVYVAAGSFLYAFSDSLPSLGGGFRGL